MLALEEDLDSLSISLLSLLSVFSVYCLFFPSFRLPSPFFCLFVPWWECFFSDSHGFSLCYVFKGTVWLFLLRCFFNYGFYRLVFYLSLTARFEFVRSFFLLLFPFSSLLLFLNPSPAISLISKEITLRLHCSPFSFVFFYFPAILLQEGGIVVVSVVQSNCCF